jgi:hypothetical protein
LTIRRDVDGASKFGRDTVQDGARCLGIGVPQLAARAAVSPDTAFRLEKGERLHQRTIIAIREALEAAGVEFTDENDGRPSVRLKPK